MGEDDRNEMKERDDEKEGNEEDEESMFLGMYPALTANEDDKPDGCKVARQRPNPMARQKPTSPPRARAKKLLQTPRIYPIKELGTVNPMDLFTKVQTNMAFKGCENTPN